MEKPVQRGAVVQPLRWQALGEPRCVWHSSVEVLSLLSPIKFGSLSIARALAGVLPPVGCGTRHATAPNKISPSSALSFYLYLTDRKANLGKVHVYDK